jgi:DNA-binding transcriptional regulator PaaX
MFNSRTSSAPPPDASRRRIRLYAEIQRRGGTITSAQAARINAAHGFGPNRNTARLDLVALAGQGRLTYEDVDGRRRYTPIGGDHSADDV